MIVELRRRTLLPLDEVLGCLRESIPKLTRSSLHRCFDVHGISRLPKSPDQACKRGKFADAAIGYVPINISELRLAQAHSRSPAIDRIWCEPRHVACSACLPWLLHNHSPGLR